MTRRARMLVAGVIAAVALAGMVVSLVRAVRGSDGPGGFALRDQHSAEAGFSSFAEARVALDDKCQRVLVATTTSQREQGLRGIRSLGPYAGMLFVFPNDSDARFTMAQTPLPLTIGWYSAQGGRVSVRRMIPCPQGTDATCPAYGAARRYRYAFETARGSVPTAIGACAS